ncbi:hypothetical protein, partial [Marinobacter sp.]|uniref:hypothetical protein n=1 Tax=Marinobacter sp. TaxID=50741 RepID=UPI0025852BF7
VSETRNLFMAFSFCVEGTAPCHRMQSDVERNAIPRTLVLHNQALCHLFYLQKNHLKQYLDGYLVLPLSNVRCG